MTDREYIIFCDESDKKGDYYSNFYGGVLVGASNYQRLTNKFEALKNELNFGKEIKWQRVTDQYLEKYVELMSCFFQELRDGHLKVRIMFRQNVHARRFDSSEDRDLEYFKLYYQFIKHGFGIQYMDHDHEEVHLRLYFDQFPDTSERAVQFKGYLQGLQKVHNFKDSRIRIRPGDIAEVKSHHHILLQCLDVILGAMVFRLNNKHKLIPAGKKRRGKRTIAKEKLYRHILSEIKTIHPGFNIGISTGLGNGGLEKNWLDAYRHWKFVPKDMVYDKTKFKKAKK